MQGIEPCASWSRTMRATGAPHPDRIDFIKFTLDIKEKEDYILKSMSEKVKAILPKDYCVGEISLSTALGEVLGGIRWRQTIMTAPWQN